MQANQVIYGCNEDLLSVKDCTYVEVKEIGAGGFGTVRLRHSACGPVLQCSA